MDTSGTMFMMRQGHYMGYVSWAPFVGLLLHALIDQCVHQAVLSERARPGVRKQAASCGKRLLLAVSADPR